MMFSPKEAQRPIKPYAIPFDQGKKLIYAVIKGDIKTIKELVPRTFNPNQPFMVSPGGPKNYLGILAITNDRPGVLIELLKLGLWTTSKNERSLNLFTEAASIKQVSPAIIDILFRPSNDGYYLNDQPASLEFNTAVHMAALNNNLYLLEKLLDMGFKVKVGTLKNSYGDSALSLAIKTGRATSALMMAWYMIGVSRESWEKVVDKDGYNALELAKRHSMPAVVEALETKIKGPLDPYSSLCRQCRKSLVKNVNGSDSDDDDEEKEQDSEERDAFEEDDYIDKDDGISDIVDMVQKLSVMEMAVDTLEKKLKADKESYTSQTTLMEDTIDSMALEREKALEEAENTFVATLEKIKVEHEEEIARLLDELHGCKEKERRHGEELMRIRTSAAYKATYQNSSDDEVFVPTHGLTRAAQDQIEATWRKRLEDVQKAHKEKLMDTEERLEEITSRFNSDLDAQEARHKKEVGALKDQHSTNLDTAHKEYQILLSDAIESHKIHLRRLNDEYKRDLAGVRDEGEHRITGLEMDYKDNLTSLDRCQEEIVELKKALVEANKTTPTTT